MPLEPSARYRRASAFNMYSPARNPAVRVPSHRLRPLNSTVTGRRLLRRNLGFHLPPRLQDHLVPPLLQERLPLVAVRAPPLRVAFAAGRGRGRIAAAVLCLVGRLVELILQVVPRDQVRMGRHRRELGRRRRSLGVVTPRRRRRLEGDRGLYTCKSLAYHASKRVK